MHEHPLPAVKTADWGERRIDAFVLDELSSNGLAQSPGCRSADVVAAVVARSHRSAADAGRARSFEADAASDAYVRQVERLLASPHYGERWGRFWLDLVRYCDTAEPWSIDQAAHAWLYRDWVVQALNDDMPYDRFLELQLAADLIPDAGPTDIAALGFPGFQPRVLEGAEARSVGHQNGGGRGVGRANSYAVGRPAGADRRLRPLPRSQVRSRQPGGLLRPRRRAGQHEADSPGAAAGIRGQSRRRRARANQGLAEDRVRSCWRTSPRPTSRNRRRPTWPDRSPNWNRRRRISASRWSTRSKTPACTCCPTVPTARGWSTSRASRRTSPMQIRGNPSNLGPVVPRRFLSVLSAGAPAPFQQGSGRRELARALVTEPARWRRG